MVESKIFLKRWRSWPEKMLNAVQIRIWTRLFAINGEKVSMQIDQNAKKTRL